MIHSSNSHRFMPVRYVPAEHAADACNTRNAVIVDVRGGLDGCESRFRLTQLRGFWSMREELWVDMIGDYGRCERRLPSV